VAYLVRSFQTNARIRSLTTGTFNRVVKDRIAVRRSGANSVQANPLQERIRLSSKPFNHTCCLKPCQREPFTEFPRDFHSGKIRRGRTGEQKSSFQRTMVWPSASKALIPAQAEAEDRKLRKELTFGGPCLEGTLQKPTLVSESSPVAGAT
jgi:hypothetical protein